MGTQRRPQVVHNPADQQVKRGCAVGKSLRSANDTASAGPSTPLLMKRKGGHDVVRCRRSGRPSTHRYSRAGEAAILMDPAPIQKHDLGQRLLHTGPTGGGGDLRAAPSPSDLGLDG